ncbi:MAG TPA: pyridoxal phosphate-dependent aminotransferase [Longimicrobiaceae bacterium]|nr:pyridoxal phosphate-dependent aminotransferase [Longimicrobiaceae bacterium]
MTKHAKHVENVATAMSIKFNSYVYDMKQAGEDVIVLSLGEAFFDIPLFPFDTLPFPELYHYTHSRGITGLRRKLAAYYHGQYGVPVDPATEIIITAGSKIALHMCFMALLDPGDEVVVHEPAWVSYSEQIRLCHGNPVMVPYDVPVEGLAEWITPKTRALVLCSPQNPTGRVYTRDELHSLHRLAEERGIYLLADEAYSDFLVDEEFVSCGVGDPEKRHTIICNSMSKNYGMSGWRIGYVVSNPGLIAQVLKINQHLITCPATILEQYLERHFDDILEITKPQIGEVVKKRAHLGEYMKELGLDYMEGTATFYFFVRISDSGLSSEDFCARLLAERKVCVVPGSGYGRSCDGFVRVSVGTESLERTRRGIRAIREMIDAARAGAGPVSPATVVPFSAIAAIPSPV